MLDNLRFKVFKERIESFLQLKPEESLWNKVREHHSFFELYKPICLMHILDYLIINEQEQDICHSTKRYFDQRQFGSLAGYLSIELSTRIDFAREALIMRNCLRTYYSSSTQGRFKIVSLLDSKTLLPLFNICLEDNNVKKVNGPRNSPGPDSIRWCDIDHIKNQEQNV